MSQQQTQQDSGQRVLAIELRSADKGGFASTLLLPFGLELGSGVTLKLDEQPEGNPHQFKTCLPAGCLVPITLDAKTIETWRNATKLTITATTADGKAFALPISLKGVPAALDRLKALNAG